MPKPSRPDLTLFLDILLKLEDLDIGYVVIGGFAATLYGITRATFDIDIIVDLGETHIRELAAAYPAPRYYADPDQMRAAMRNGTSFNIIDSTRGEKADLFPLSMDPRYIPAFENRVRQPVELAGLEPFEVWAARPEDVIVGKLLAWEEGRSRRHANDIFEMMLSHYLGEAEVGFAFDEASVDERAAAVGAAADDLWQLLKSAAREEAERR